MFFYFFLICQQPEFNIDRYFPDFELVKFFLKKWNDFQSKCSICSNANKSSQIFKNS